MTSKKMRDQQKNSYDITVTILTPYFKSMVDTNGNNSDNKDPLVIDTMLGCWIKRSSKKQTVAKIIDVLLVKKPLVLIISF